MTMHAYSTYEGFTEGCDDNPGSKYHVYRPRVNKHMHACMQFETNLVHTYPRAQRYSSFLGSRIEPL